MRKQDNIRLLSLGKRHPADTKAANSQANSGTYPHTAAWAQFPDNIFPFSARQPSERTGFRMVFIISINKDFSKAGVPTPEMTRLPSYRLPQARHLTLVQNPPEVKNDEVQ